MLQIPDLHFHFVHVCMLFAATIFLHYIQYSVLNIYMQGNILLPAGKCFTMRNVNLLLSKDHLQITRVTIAILIHYSYILFFKMLKTVCNSRIISAEVYSLKVNIRAYCSYFFN